MSNLSALSLGLGVQSSTLLLMSENGELPLLDVAIFADTKWEPPWVYSYLAYLQQVITRIPIHIVTAGNLAQDVLAARGSKGKINSVQQPPFYVVNKMRESDPIGMLWRKCTAKYKIKPIEAVLRDMVKRSTPRKRAVPLVDLWLGISVDELQRAHCSRVKWIQKRYPLIEKRMRREDCINWLVSHGHPIPEKSACIGCPYYSDSYWRNLRDKHPTVWQEAVAFDDELRTSGHLPGTHGDVYVHRSAIPLSVVDLSTAEDVGQMSLFAREECSGMCGV